MDEQSAACGSAPAEGDYIVRGTAADGMIRAFAATTRLTVQEARDRHQTSPVVTAALGRLLTCGAMMGSMLKDDGELITLMVRGDGPIGGLTVTADAHGHVKGYAGNNDVWLPLNDAGKLAVGDMTVNLPVLGDLADGVYTGTVITESLQRISLLLH